MPIPLDVDDFFLISRWDKVSAALPKMVFEHYMGSLSTLFNKDRKNRTPLEPKIGTEAELFDKIMRRFSTMGFMYEMPGFVLSEKGPRPISLCATTRHLASCLFIREATLMSTVVATICTDVAFVLQEDVTRPLTELRNETERIKAAYEAFKAENTVLRPHSRQACVFTRDFTSRR